MFVLFCKVSPIKPFLKEDIGKTQKKAIVDHMAKKGNQSPGSDDDTEPEDGAKPNGPPKKKRSVVSTAASHKPKRLRTQK